MDDNSKKILEHAKNSFLDYDPAYFVKNNLTIDGQEFNILDSGWKFMSDIYRYIAFEAIQKTGKKVVIKKGRQVGATIMGAALDLYFTNSALFSRPAVRVAHLFPIRNQAQKFSQDKLEGMIRTAKNDFINKNKLKSKSATDNLTMKQFETGTLWIESLGADADSIRGMTIDIGFFDEVQDMLPDAIGNAQKILTAAKYGPIGSGVQVFYGTPKEKNSYFSDIWEISDQRYYYFGCEHCNKTYPFYLPDNDGWKKIWVREHVVVCPHCQKESTKQKSIDLGCWIPTKKDSKYVGFHINQLYIPYFTRETVNDLLPENNPTQTERLFKNEVLGEFYSGSGATLTRAEIYEKCRDKDREFASRIEPNRKSVYLGCDWGGKDDDSSSTSGQSFSCVVVLSADKDGVLSVEHAHKLKKNDFNYKKETIQEMYRRFSVNRGVSDWFFGQDVVNDLQMIYRDRFIGAQGSGSLSISTKYREDELILSYNKDLLIEELFDQIRKGRVRFPWKSYEQFYWLIDHCVSMDSKIKVVGGQPMKTYVKGGGPNDGLMALMYAYMAYKFDITNGYKIKPGMIKESNFPMPVLANFSRRI